MLLFLERAAVRGIAGEYPVYVTGVDSSEAVEFSDVPSLAAYLVRELNEIEQRLATLGRPGADPELFSDTVSFIKSVRSLLDSSEQALTKLSPSDQSFEALRYECLSLMKTVGRAAEILRHRGDPRFQAALNSVMRHLIDTVYLDLGTDCVDEAAWLITREGTEQRLIKLQAAVGASVIIKKS